MYDMMPAPGHDSRFWPLREGAVSIDPEQSTPVPQLSVVVPVHDEQENVLPLIAELHAALDGVVPYELVFVDDGSGDATPERLAQAQRADEGRRDGRLRVVRHRVACGQSTAVHSGVSQARGQWIATLDGDGQNDPADIPRLLAVLTAPDRPPRLAMVAGWRTTRRDSWLVKLSSRVANGVRGRMLRDRTPDTGCGLKLFERDLFLRLPYFDHMHRFLPALVHRAGGDGGERAGEPPAALARPVALRTAQPALDRHRRSARCHVADASRATPRTA